MDFVSLTMQLAAEIFEFTNTKEANKYKDRLVELELALMKEEARDWDKQDDKKIVQIKKEISIIGRAAITELNAARNK